MFHLQTALVGDAVDYHIRCGHAYAKQKWDEKLSELVHWLKLMIISFAFRYTLDILYSPTYLVQETAFKMSLSIELWIHSLVFAFVGCHLHVICSYFCQF